MKKLLLFCIMVSMCNIIVAQNRIIVSKKKFQLIVFNSEFDTVFCCKCATGLNSGNKQYVDDKRTPESRFLISSIKDSMHWVHGFHDGVGVRKNAYGPFLSV